MREGESELGFELAARIGVSCGVGGGPGLSDGQVSGPPHIRPIFGMDMRGAGQFRRLSAV